MCEKCQELMDKYYPDLEQADQKELLFGATCFPFGPPELIEKQLIDLIENTDGSLGEALSYANERFKSYIEGGS